MRIPGPDAPPLHAPQPPVRAQGATHLVIVFVDVLVEFVQGHACPQVPRVVLGNTESGAGVRGAAAHQGKHRTQGGAGGGGGAGGRGGGARGRPCGGSRAPAQTGVPAQLGTGGRGQRASLETPRLLFPQGLGSAGALPFPAPAETWVLPGDCRTKQRRRSPTRAPALPEGPPQAPRRCTSDDGGAIRSPSLCGTYGDKMRRQSTPRYPETPQHHSCYDCGGWECPCPRNTVYRFLGGSLGLRQEQGACPQPPGKQSAGRHQQAHRAVLG